MSSIVTFRSGNLRRQQRERVLCSLWSRRKAGRRRDVKTPGLSQNPVERRWIMVCRGHGPRARRPSCKHSCRPPRQNQGRAASNRAMAVFMLLFPRNPFAAVVLEVVAIVQCRSSIAWRASLMFSPVCRSPCSQSALWGLLGQQGGLPSGSTPKRSAVNVQPLLAQPFGEQQTFDRSTQWFARASP